MSPYVRDVVPADAAAWERLRRQAMPDRSEHRRRIDGYFAHDPYAPDYVLFVLDEVGTPVGFAELGSWDPQSDRPIYEVEAWYVEPAARRMGRGRALIRHAEAWARSRRALELFAPWRHDDEEQLVVHTAVGFSANESDMSFSIYLDEEWQRGCERGSSRDLERMRAHDATMRGFERPDPSQRSIDQLIARAASVRLQNLEDEEPVVLEESLDKSELIAALRIDEDPKTFETCMCDGELAIEFLDAAGQCIATLGIHHGNAISWNEWLLNARTLHARAFRNWLRRCGVTEDSLER